MSTATAPELLEQLVDLVVERLAPLVAAELAGRLELAVPAPNGLGTSGLLSLDELVAQLPPAKTPATWKRWLYERLRLGDVPGAVKLGGSWFVDAEKVQAWIADGARPGTGV